MKSLFCFVLLDTIVVFADDIVESAREIPVADEVDVVVVGGTAAGVSAATAAAEGGARVFLAGGFPYLGEDVAGTLELECAGDERATPLERRLRQFGGPLAPYAYEHPRGFRFIGGFQYVNDRFEKFSTTVAPICPWDSVFYTNATAITCTLERQERISSVEVLVFENDDRDAEAAMSVDHRGIIPKGKRGPLTGDVRLVFLDGPRAGEVLPLVRGERHEPILGVVIRDIECTTQHTTTYSAPIGDEIRRVRIEVEPAAGAFCHLISRIRFHRPDTVHIEENPSPLAVKRVLDAELIRAGVRFITGSPVTDLVVDGEGRPSGVVIANRNGRQAVLAKSVVDATRYATLSHLGKPLALGSPGKVAFTRVIQSGVAPDGIRSEAFDVPRHAPHRPTEWPRLFRCELELPLPDWSYRSFARAEVLARDLTWHRTTFDDADQLRLRTMPAIPACPFLRTVPDVGVLSDRIRRGSQAGAEAAIEAKGRGALAGLSVKGEPSAGEPALEIREQLSGLRPYGFSRSVRTIPSPAHGVPVLGEFDVVVVGGGTSGTPAGIAAGRAGAKTLIVEYLHVLGGVGTDGMVLGYYAGNHCGFTLEFKNGEQTFGAETHVYNRSGTWRRMVREAGVEVWYGTLAEGVAMKGDKVEGVVVVTPFGRGLVRAKVVIDATGNADVAAAAGAKTEFLGAHELAVQSAGQAPHRLGRGAGNSDFGLVNDADAMDLWLFGVRARAGAPDAWDVQQLVDSRERRRIVSDYALTGWDVVSERKPADTVVVAYSKQDGHGYFSDEFGCVSPDDGLSKRYARVPLRSLLPRGISGLAVIGLGKGVSRDVVPFTRMQADLMNEGFGAGLCAAAAARESDGDFRNFDLRRVQRMLVEKGNLPPEALQWTDEQTVPTDAELKDLVAAMAEGNQGSERLYVFRERARPFLAEAYRTAVKPAALQAYAVMLGLVGDATGAETLAALMDGRQPIALRKQFSYGRSMTVIGVAIAAGRTKAKAVEDPIRRRIDRLTVDSTITQFRMATLAAEAYASSALAEPLAAALERPGIGGWARAKPEDLGPMGGYGVGPEIDRCTKELALARALWACGDCRGLARRTLEAYAKDPRGIYAEHAAHILRRVEGIQARIDAVSAVGGGTVNIPAGRHVVGQLYLKNNVELHLEEGAVLEGAVGLHNYVVHALPYSEGTWSAVVMGLGVTNVAITGKGEIFGNGQAFERVRTQGVCQEGFRPRGIFFSQCKGVRLEDFKLRDAACWGIVLKCCDGCVARRVKIDSNANHNNDGFDVEARNVLIEDCDVSSGDDAYCVKSNDPGFTVENVTVRRCTARTHCNAFKIGTATHGAIRNIRFEHCRSELPRRVYRDLAPMPADFVHGWPEVEGSPHYLCGPGIAAICVECVDGGFVEGISFENIEVEGCQVPIFIRGGNRRSRTCGIPPGNLHVLRNVTLSHVRGRAESTLPSTITGVAACRPQKVLLRDIAIECVGAGTSREGVRCPGEELDGAYPEATMFRAYRLPVYGLYVDRPDDVKMENVKFTLRPGTNDDRPPLDTEKMVRWCAK